MFCVVFLAPSVSFLVAAAEYNASEGPVAFQNLTAAQANAIEIPDEKPDCDDVPDSFEEETPCDDEYATPFPAIYSPTPLPKSVTPTPPLIAPPKSGRI